MDTLENAKQELRDNWQKGVECQCCHQFVKVYKRPIYSGIVKSLIGLYHLDDGYHHVSEFQLGQKSGGGDFAKLVYWGLIEERPKNESTKEKRTSGFWHITDKGRLFVLGELMVLSHIWLFDGKSFGFTGKEVGVREVLGKKFNYEELMK